jgi:hypothetical protein
MHPNAKDAAGILLITDGTSQYLYLGDASTTEQIDLAFSGQNLHASAMIAAVPVNPILWHAAGKPRILSPIPGHSLPL